MLDIDNKLVVVNSKVLPEVIMKVLHAKRLRARGEAKSSTEACRAVGISRSAYYKYKDSVFAYEEKLNQKIVSFYLVLRDEKGVLSSILTRLYELNTNVLTVNQNIPIDEVATVTISFRFENDLINANAVKSEISNMNGVVDVKIISGE
ncbi:MAG: ACT domain-containing protein [Clostridiales bacterium]|nr:ACT domain-containing protein [Clostridiales bacterium]